MNSNKENYLGIDYGTKILGLSFFNKEINLIISLKQINNDNILFNNLKNIIDEYNISNIVLGFPYTLNNFVSERHKLINDFFLELKKNFSSVQIDIFDESYSTEKSLDIQKKFNIKTSKLKKNKDSISACIILENYLKSKKIYII